MLVGTVGNYNRQKGHERFVEAAARLRASDASLRFCLFGAPTSGQTGYYEREVVARAERYGLTKDRVLQFVDAGEGVASLIHAVDIFVLTSRAEGVPTALLEAMTAGVPAVAMDVGSIGEAIVDGTTGLVVAAGDLGGFIAGVRMLASDRALRARMGAAAAVRAQAEFSSERCADRHVEAYTQALRLARRFSGEDAESKPYVGRSPSLTSTPFRFNTVIRTALAAPRTSHFRAHYVGPRTSLPPFAGVHCRAVGRRGAEDLRQKLEDAYFKTFVVAMLLCWSPLKPLAYTVPFVVLFWTATAMGGHVVWERLLQWFAVLGDGHSRVRHRQGRLRDSQRTACCCHLRNPRVSVGAALASARRPRISCGA